MSKQINGIEYILEKLYENLLARKKMGKLAVEAHDFNLSSQEAEACKCNLIGCQPGIYSEFQDSQSYILVRLHLPNKKSIKQTKMQKNPEIFTKVPMKSYAFTLVLYSSSQKTEEPQYKLEQ